VKVFSLENANKALNLLRRGNIAGALVLSMFES
jgi:D-arabinose 1-dehydrogenase-like Zn-dependent alcohol dehydrogenase